MPSLEKVVVFYPDCLEEDDFVISLDTLKEYGSGRSYEEFTQEVGELTPTLKLKRRVLLARYKDLIDGFYS